MEQPAALALELFVKCKEREAKRAAFHVWAITLPHTQEEKRMEFDDFWRAMKKPKVQQPQDEPEHLKMLMNWRPEADEYI